MHHVSGFGCRRSSSGSSSMRTPHGGRIVTGGEMDDRRPPSTLFLCRYRIPEPGSVCYVGHMATEAFANRRAETRWGPLHFSQAASSSSAQPQFNDSPTDSAQGDRHRCPPQIQCAAGTFHSTPRWNNWSLPYCVRLEPETGNAPGISCLQLEPGHHDPYSGILLRLFLSVWRRQSACVIYWQPDTCIAIRTHSTAPSSKSTPRGLRCDSEACA